MADYRSMYEGKYLGAWNLMDNDGNKRELTLTIVRVEAQQIIGEGGKTNKKPVVHFEPRGDHAFLPMVAGKTVAKTVAAMYGNDTKHWIGKRITLFATTTNVGGTEKDCIRVRPNIPAEPSGAKGKPTQDQAHASA
jgi:hypothetical protein